MSETVTPSDVRSFVLALTQVEGSSRTDAERIDLLRALEELKSAAAAAQAWVRRLYAHPVPDRLVTMDSRRRRFSGRHRVLLVHRDQTCRTSWCDAPVRHVDHVQPHAGGGATSTANAQGLCESCNHAKEAAGWRARGTPGGRVETTTPTGHTYRSAPPPAPRPRAVPGRAEVGFARTLVLIA